MKYKLDFELVPDSCWYSNLRTILSKKQWDFIKADAKERAEGKCMICGRKTDRLEAHERWSYDEENCVQKLEDIVSICKDCHNVIHIGRTQLKGDEERAEKHFMKVNNCSYAEYRQALGKANEEHKRRNLVPEWKLYLTYLKRYIND
ncbi:MAG: HNH endonuclease [Clostridiales bacterium]|nr:HNH endonuclease [Clostridiales bacterium]